MEVGSGIMVWPQVLYASSNRSASDRSAKSLADLPEASSNRSASDRSAKSLADLSEAGRSAKLFADL